MEGNFLDGVKMKKLICFDLDGTLTQHRSKLEKENRVILDKLQKSIR